MSPQDGASTHQEHNQRTKRMGAGARNTQRHCKYSNATLPTSIPVLLPMLTIADICAEITPRCVGPIPAVIKVRPGEVMPASPRPVRTRASSNTFKPGDQPANLRYGDPGPSDLTSTEQRDAIAENVLMWCYCVGMERNCIGMVLLCGCGAIAWEQCYCVGVVLLCRLGAIVLA